MTDNAVLGDRARDRGLPTASDAIAFTGGIGIALGVLLFTIDFYAHGHGRPPGVAFFAALIVAGYLGLIFLPAAIHPAAVTVIVVGVPGTLGWWLLPNAHRFADVRPFLVLVILAWAACWLVPRTRGRTIFVAATLLLLWLWVLGEVAGTDAYSAAPVPSPPAHTMFSLGALTHPTHIVPVVDSSGGSVSITDLDRNDPLYSLAQRCEFFNGSDCDDLYAQADAGSDFATFADTCGNTQATGSGGECAQLDTSGFGNDGVGETPTPFPGLVPGTGLSTDASDKSLQIGIVSLLFGIAYLAALVLLDRRRWRGLGTAFVVPALLAMFTGTETLGNAADHAWVGGLLTLTAGVLVAVVGERGGRRFTTWAGGAFVAIGAYTFAADAANLDQSFSEPGGSLTRPALVALGAGVVLVALAYLVRRARPRSPEPATPEPSSTDPVPTVPPPAAPEHPFMPPLPEPKPPFEV